MIVERLTRGEASVGDLTELVQKGQSTVSKHLAVLRSNGIVEGRREGATIYYGLLCPCVVEFLSCVVSVLKQRRKARV